MSIKLVHKDVKVQLEKRLPVLKISLMLEGLASATLARLLGIKDEEETYSFSNTSKALTPLHRIYNPALKKK